jgi:hypothetical protein
MNMYAITIESGRVAELFYADAAPEGAVPISDEDGQILRRASRFADYTVSAEGVIDHDPLPADPPTREALKAARAATVERIRVTTTAGHEFDGDETSQGRMARAILGLDAAGPAATIPWVLADNSVINATAAELREALILAGQAQAAVWVLA